MSLSKEITNIFLNRCIYYYDFDLITGIVDQDIIDKEGNNYTEQLGLSSPCTFDELMERSYDENYFGIWHVADDGINTLSQQSLLSAYNKGRNLVEAIIYIPKNDKYYRIDYYLIKDDFTGYPHVYVSCMDASDEEKSREKIIGELRNEKSDIEEIVESAKIGIWHIYLYDGEKPRMQGTHKMKELLGVEDYNISEEDLYDFWYSRIKSSSVPSVNASVNDIISEGFSENEYYYIHPTKGEIIVRCGGTAIKKEGKGYILRGYHSDVTDIVKEDERQKHQLRDALEELKEKKKLLERSNKELADKNAGQYAQLQEIAALNDLLRAQQESKDELHLVLETIAEIFYSLHEIDLINDVVTEFNAHNEVKDIVNHHYGTVNMMTNVISAVISDEYRAAALEFTDLSTLADRMKDKKVLSGEFVGKRIGWFLAMFITMDTDEEGRPTKVIFSTRSIDVEKREAERLIRKSQTDELTGLLNRRAYEEDIYEHNDIPAENDFIYISLDVNGLKVINDTVGHAAGDELIVGSSYCMKKALGSYGKIYRIGGDEFVAILFVNNQKLTEILEDFDRAIIDWSGKLIDSLSVSYGYVSKDDYPNASVRELAVNAEKKMYESKSAYYRKQGVDRRGQADAHRALCELYTKILRINITEDTYQIVNMDFNEQTAEKGFTDKISEWLRSFGLSGQVHPDDLEEYLRLTDVEYIKDYFANNKTSLNIFYRRKYAYGFKQVMMEMIPTNDYSDDNQTLFLYVKNIDK